MLNFIKKARELPLVSQEAAAAYKAKANDIKAYLDQAMQAEVERDNLIGDNSLDIMYDNHAHHTNFMSNVFQLGLYEVLIKVVVWVYSSYHARGFSYDYFERALAYWIEAINKFIAPEYATELSQIYQWLIDHHQEMIKVASDKVIFEQKEEMELQKTKLLFLQYLLEGNSRACMEIASEFQQDQNGVKKFYLQVIQPAMYEIGIGWERGRISVAQEHLASAIISRVMSAFYQSIIIEEAPQDKVAIVAAAPNEYHEIGAHMVADFLEMDGWQVYFLGANTPTVELLKMVRDKNPVMIAISVTMPFNLKYVKQMIEAIRTNFIDQNIKVMAGGLSVNMADNTWEKIGADGCAYNAEQAVELANKWHQKEAG